MPTRMKILLAVGLSVVLHIAAAPIGAQASEAEAWKAFMTPGAAHTYMAQYVGHWNIETRFWHEPGQTPEITRGRAEYQMKGGSHVRG